MRWRRRCGGLRRRSTGTSARAVGCRRGAVRAEDAERLAGQGDGEDIALDDANAVVAQPFRPDRIRLDGDHPQRTAGERARYRTRTGAYL